MATPAHDNFTPNTENYVALSERNTRRCGRASRIDAGLIDCELKSTARGQELSFWPFVRFFSNAVLEL